MITAKCYKWPDPRFSNLDHDLEIGKEYEVDEIVVGQGIGAIDIHLKDNSRPYNYIFFQFFEDGKEIDIRSNPYNPYK